MAVHKTIAEFGGVDLNPAYVTFFLALVCTFFF